MYLGLVGGVLDLVAARKLKRVSQQLLDSSIAAALDPDVSSILRRFAAPLGDSVEATNAFWVYVRDPKNSKLFSEEFKLWWEQSDHWTDALRVKFVEDFGSEVAQLKGLKTTAMMEGWSKLATRDIPLSSNIKFLEEPAVVDRLVGLYDDAHLRQVYQALLSAQTQPQSITAFLKTFDDLGAAYYTRFADDANLVKSWFRYYDEPVLRLEFNKMGNVMTLQWCEHYGVLAEHLLLEIRSKPLTFRNWKNLDEVDKQILKGIPDEWIPSVYQFDNFCFIKKLCPVEIPLNARVFESLKVKGYAQVEFCYTFENFKWEVRAHTEIPDSPGVGNGNVWVIRRQVISDGTFQPYQEFLSGNDWIRANIWFELVKKHSVGLITETEKLILKNGHFKVK